MRALEITGQKFGKLTAISRIGSDKHGKIKWEFVCDCGSSTIATGSEVKKGKIRSCGCLKLITGPANAIRGRLKIVASKTKHGQSLPGSEFYKEYCIWKTMKQRCSCEQSVDYSSYGGRGIIVCDRWENDFNNFFEDMGPRPEGKYSIERIDNDLGYSPDNCKWGTDLEQANNRRKRRIKNG